MKNNIFRVFISSTFSDVAPYRDALMKDVYPKIETFCERKSASFHPVDLRWGINEETAKNNEVLKTCLVEVERCKALSPKPSFLMLIRNRYGWTPPPYEIEADEMNHILLWLNKNISSGSEKAKKQKQLIQEWYELDENNVPHIYFLKKRTAEYADSKIWEIKEAEIQQELYHCAKESDVETSFGKDALVKYYASATEQEIYKGLLSNPEYSEQVYAIFIEDFDEPEDERITALKQKIRQALQEERIFTFNKGDSLSDLCENVCDFLEKTIDAQLNASDNTDSFSEEKLRQENFVNLRTDNYVSREDDALFLEFTEKIYGKIGFVSGHSGCGKTSLLANFIKSNDVPHIFCGVSDFSQDVHKAVSYILNEIKRVYKIEENIPPVNYRNATSVFEKVLKAIPSTCKPLIVIDSIDKIFNLELLQQGLLNIDIPEYCRIIVSSAEKLENYDISPESSEIFILSEMKPDEAEEMFLKMLLSANRTVNSSQLEIVKKKFAEGVEAIYVAVLAKTAQKWTSTYSVSEDAIKSTSEEILLDSLCKLADGSKYGNKLVWHSLGYIANSRYGLTDKEIMSLLSGDEQVRAEVSNEYWPLKKSFPQSVWSMIYCEIMDYLTQIRSDEYLLMTFYHSLIERVVNNYLSPEEKEHISSNLLDFFKTQNLYIGDKYDKKYLIRPNKRKAQELYFQAIRSGEIEFAKALLESPCYCDICIRSGNLNELLELLEGNKESLKTEFVLSAIKNNLIHIMNFPSDFLPLLCSEGGFENIDIADDKFITDHGIVTFSEPIYDVGINNHNFFYDDIIKIEKWDSKNLIAVVRPHEILLYDPINRSYLPGTYYTIENDIQDIQFLDDDIVILENQMVLFLSYKDNKIKIKKRIRTEFDGEGIRISPNGDKLAVIKNKFYGSQKKESVAQIYELSNNTLIDNLVIELNKSRCAYVDWYGSDMIAVAYGNLKSTLRLYSIKTKKFTKKFKIPHIQSICGSSTMLAVNCANKLYLFHNNRIIKYAFYYPFSKLLYTSSCSRYTAAIIDSVRLEITDNLSKGVYNVDINKTAKAIKWGENETSFIVEYHDGTVSVHNIIDVITENNYIMTMPKPMPTYEMHKIKKISFGDEKYDADLIKGFWNALKRDVFDGEYSKVIDISDSNSTYVTMKRSGMNIPFEATLSSTGLVAVFYPDISLIKVIDSVSKKLVFQFQTKKYGLYDLRGHSVIWSEDGRYLAVKNKSTLKICDVVNKKWVYQYKTDSIFTCIMDIDFYDGLFRLILSDGNLVKCDLNNQNSISQKILPESLSQDKDVDSNIVCALFNDNILLMNTTNNYVDCFCVSSSNNPKSKIKNSREMLIDKISGSVLLVEENKQQIKHIDSSKQNITVLDNPSFTFVRQKAYDLDIKYNPNGEKNITYDYIKSRKNFGKMVKVKNLIFALSNYSDTINILQGNEQQCHVAFSLNLDCNILDFFVDDQLNITVITDEAPFVTYYHLKQQ